jgi:hypothetical protein
MRASLDRRQLLAFRRFVERLSKAVALSAQSLRKRLLNFGRALRRRWTRHPRVRRPFAQRRAGFLRSARNRTARFHYRNDG